MSGTYLHPSYESESFTWTADGRVVSRRHPHGSGEAEQAWLASPLKWMIDKAAADLKAGIGVEANKPIFFHHRFFHQRG